MMSSNNILSPANGGPVIIPSQDIVLGLYYMTVDRSFKKGEGMQFCAPWEVEAAYDAGHVDLHARIKVRLEDGNVYDTTCGRILVWERLPKNTVPFSEFNTILTKKTIGKLINLAYQLAGIKATVLFADKIKSIGYEFATRAGVTIGVKDMTIPDKKEEIIGKAQAEVDEITRQYRDGVITETEKYNKVVDVWTNTTDEVSNAMVKQISVDRVVNPADPTDVREDISFNPIYMMSNSGARGNKDQMRQLAGMRGLMAKPSGDIIETPITSSFREGLTVLQYFTSTHGARKGLADTALKTANSGYLTRRLVDVVQDVIVSTDDCGTVDGIEMSAQMEGGEVKIPLKDRILGRTLLYGVADPVSGEELFPENTLVTEKVAKRIEAAGINSVTIRSALTCRAERGVCAKCYGRDLGRGHLVNVGETVGIVAAQSIGEPGTQLTMRTFHIGGTASRTVEQSSYEVRTPGTVQLFRVRSVTNRRGEVLVLGKSGQVSVIDDKGQEAEKYTLPAGARLYVTDGQHVLKGTRLADWDPSVEPFIAEADGIVRFGDIKDGKTVQEKVDETTRQTSLVITDYRSTTSKEVLRPRIALVDEDGEPILRQQPALAKADADDAHAALIEYFMPVGAILQVKDGDAIQAGDILARRPREASKTKDIVGGLPRVAELFEARKPKEMAVVSEISGLIEFTGESKGKRKILVRPENGDPKEYLIPKGKQIIVSDGDYIDAGECLTEGSPELHDILHTKGEKYLAKYLVDEIQDVYRLQGVAIDDKHIEVIVRQMLKKVSIIDPGQTTFLVGEQVEKFEFREENAKAIAEGRQPATAEPLVLGISQAALSSLSWVAAASFQETTKVLTEASLKGKYDYLRGLKENVVVGRLLPAGTGYREYVNQGILVPEQKELPNKFLDELEEDPVIPELDIV